MEDNPSARRGEMKGSRFEDRSGAEDYLKSAQMHSRLKSSSQSEHSSSD